MLIWYKMIHKFSYEHNNEHSRSIIIALHHIIIGKIFISGAYNYINLVIKS